MRKPIASPPNGLNKKRLTQLVVSGLLFVATVAYLVAYPDADVMSLSDFSSIDESNISLNGSIDLFQVQFLDYLNGEFTMRDMSSIFGGSITNQTFFNPHATWKYIYSHSKDVAAAGCDGTDFHKLALCARAHLIAYRLLHEAPKSFVRQLARVSPEKSLRAFRYSLRKVVESLEQHLYPWLFSNFKSVEKMHNSLKPTFVGITMTCGNTHFYLAQHLIVSLQRVFNVSLPFEVFYAGENDLSFDRVEFFKSMPNVTVVNLHSYFSEETMRGSTWSYKPFAILASKFSKVLFMDPDVAFFIDPRSVLQSDIFNKNGQIFYRDRKVWSADRVSGPKLLHEMNPYLSQYARAGFYAPSQAEGVHGTTEEMESGFIPLDKNRPLVLLSLLFAAKLNGHKERRIFYERTWGDKESYWFAFETLRVPYAFNPSYAGSIGVLDTKREINGHVSVCEGKHLHANEKMLPFWFHDGSILVDYRRYGPPLFNFADLNHMAVHHNISLEEQVWHDGMACIKRPVDSHQTWPVQGHYSDIIEKYKKIFKNEVVEVLEISSNVDYKSYDKLANFDDDNVELLQAQVLDFFNGERPLRPLDGKSVDFGGSLLDAPSFHLLKAWPQIEAYAKKVSTITFNPKDTIQLMLQARTHRILYRVGFDSSDWLVRQILRASRYRSKEQFITSIRSIIRDLETNLYPWISPYIQEISDLRKHSASGTAIVIAFEKGRFLHTKHLVVTLRKAFRLKIPIEVYYGTEDLSDAELEYFRSIPNVATHNINSIFPIVKDFPQSSKHFAILGSKHRYVLAIDPDVAFFKNPTQIFNSELFNKHGNLFFHCRKRWTGDLKVVDFFSQMVAHLSSYGFNSLFAASSESGASGSSCEMDPGILFIDKNISANLLSLFFAAKISMMSGLFQLPQLEVESFWFAAEALRTPYSFVPSYAGGAGLKHPSGGICGQRTLHLDDQNRPFWIQGKNMDFSGKDGLKFWLSDIHLLAGHSLFDFDDQVWYTAGKSLCIKLPRSQVSVVDGQQKRMLALFDAIFKNDI
ncbi:hypothetical protein HDU84_000718 [Entophlyctis sp. JEL0112]|nr:hypothetical protein HDU84_000718 [Entophlyctis sp. JEL0112]